MRVLGFLLVAVAYFAAAMTILANGHPHEDAYILYIFSESLAFDHRIAYFEGGPHAEGATDFLWMLLIGLLVRAGLDAAIAAALLNGLGLAVSATVLSRVALEGRAASALSVLLSYVLIGAVLLVSPIAAASYAGFSPAFYTGAIALLMYWLWRANPAQLMWLPLLAIFIGLVRPDGVIIGVVGVCVAFFYMLGSGRMGAFLGSAVVAAGIGIAYFVWRYNYFGELLPLPLYVKGSSDLTLPGAYIHIEWMWTVVPLIALYVLALLLAPGRWRLFFAGFPVAALFAALAIAEQSQNVAYRFQAPMLMYLYLGAAVLFAGGFAGREQRSPLFAVAAVLALLLVAGNAVWHAKFARKNTAQVVNVLERKQYIYFFPWLLRDAVSTEHTIALTEAGRMAYWLKGEKYDLVGLNTPETAREGASVEYIAGLDPDLIFLHVAGTIKPGLCSETENYCRVTIAQLESARVDDRNYQDVNNRVERAPLAVYEYLSANADYDLLLVRYGDSHNHLHAVKRGAILPIDQYEMRIARSFDRNEQLSYLEMKAAP